MTLSTKRKGKNRTMNLIYAIFVLLLIASPVHARDVKSEIVPLNDAFDKAYASHDFNALGEFYAQDAVVYPQGSDIIKGRKGIQDLWKSYEKDMTAVHYETIEVLDAGDYAIQFGKYDATYQGKPDHGRYMTIWKNDNGAWKIIRDSWYSNSTQ
jgi:ketosteroid isomerase-like protein